MSETNIEDADFTEDEKIGAFIVSACIFCAIGFVAFFIWGM